MKTKKETSNEVEKSTLEPIAIVGMSCRFPFASTLDAFWQLLHDGKDTIREIPKERWNVEDYYDADPTANRKTHQRHASMLSDIHDFDPFFFNISPAEAIDMSPSQKLMLELVWEAIESSSIPFNKVQGKKVGVYVGNIWADFEHLLKHKNAPISSHSSIGQSSNIIANRVSFAFGLTGPSLVLDTGCSSSLVALHLACQSLWDGSNVMSLAAGINHILDPDQYIHLTKFGGLSKKAKCSTFDIDADGFVRGEGAGTLLLKTLSNAEKDGDKIYALIRGTSVNNNGFNVNLPATSTEGQIESLEEAYSRSGILPHEVHYIEAHGTGTPLGDPNEAIAIGKFFSEGRKNKLHIGSVKTNIGHTEATAGMAGLIKVVLAMKHNLLPANLNFKTPNPEIPFEELKLKVQAELEPWPVLHDETRKAGVNSFGWGGTNAHAIVEEYKTKPTEETVLKSTEITTYCLPLSAKSQQALKAYAKSYATRITSIDNDEFKKLCIATALLKPEFDYRIIFSGSSRTDILRSIEDFIQDDNELIPHKPLEEKNKVVFVFPGQGSQWLGMGKELMQHEPLFKQTLEACDDAFKPYTDWSLLEQLHATPETSRLEEINVIQPALFAIQIALAKLWMSWGVQPHAVVGHSMGEVAAAHIAGALSLNDAAKIICTRSLLMKTVSGKGGSMAVTELTVAEAEKVIERYPQLSIAVNNSPKSTVLAGDKSDLTEVLAMLEGKGLFCRLVKVDVASHSQQMDPLKENLKKALQSITPQNSAIPMHSTVKNRIMEGLELTADYWVDNLRCAVQFASVLENLMKDNHTIFIEASPHPVLANAVNECAEAYKNKAITIPSLFREKPEQESIYKNLGDLYAKGYSLNWTAFYRATKTPRLDLPPYPFQRERYEVEDKSHELIGAKNHHGAKFPLLGNRIQLANIDHTHFWENQIGIESFPYLKDYQSTEPPILPPATYIEMLFEAASEIYNKGVPTIENLNFIRPLVFATEEPVGIQLKITTQGYNKASFQFFKKTNDGESDIWTVLAEGILHMLPKSKVETIHPLYGTNPSKAISGVEYYDQLKQLSLNYGDYFKRIVSLVKYNHQPLTQVTFTLAADERIQQTASHYKIHPALLDACLQPLFIEGVEQNQSQLRTTLLQNISEVQFLGPINYSKKIHGIATLYPLENDVQRGFTNVQAKITIINENGSPVLNIIGLKGRILIKETVQHEKEKLRNAVYRINWLKNDNANKLQVNSSGSETWLILGDEYGVSSILADKIRSANIDFIHITPGARFTKCTLSRTALVHYKMDYDSKENYSMLLHDILVESKQKIAGIIHMSGIDYAREDEDVKLDEIASQQSQGSGSILNLLQAIEVHKLVEVPRLIVVTNGILPIANDHNAVHVMTAPLHGLCKVISNELPQYKIRQYDIGVNPSSEEIEQLVAELSLYDALENEIALRGNDQYVPRLSPHVDEEHRKPFVNRFVANGTYLVTGWYDLNIQFIEWMIGEGARNFALINEGDMLTDAAVAKIVALREQGYSFKVFKADTRNYEQLKHTIQEIQTTMPELRGIIHAEGVYESKLIQDISTDDFLSLLNARMRSVWNLHLASLDLPIDTFILLTSASSLIGFTHRANYVAVNTFLDALAHRRRGKGLPANSINIGSIIGLDLELLKSEKTNENIFIPTSYEEMMNIYDKVYSGNCTQIGVVKFNFEAIARDYPRLSGSRYFSGVLAKPDDQHQNKTFIEVYRALTTSEEKVSALEHLVVQHVAKIVKASTSRIKNTMTFKGVGIDSLMAIELRKLLEKSVEAKLSVAMFWAHPSIQEYAQYLQNLLTDVSGNEIKKELPLKSLPIDASSSQWFVIPKPNPQATFRLFTFHDAGGSAALFHEWETLMGEQFEVINVELPGRGRRITEEPYKRIESLIQDLMPNLLPVLNKPFFFLGHSMGGLVAFEIIRELRRTNSQLPQTLFISSTSGLTAYDQKQVDFKLSTRELVGMYPHLDINVIGDVELQQLLVNILKADLELIYNYRYQTEELLNIPITVIHGLADERVKLDQIEKWQQETISSYQLISRPGGHRYIENDGFFVTGLITNEVTNCSYLTSSTK